MLLRPTVDGAMAITQPAHAWVSGSLARAWGNTQFAHLVPREEVCLAASLHDIGWLEHDGTPHYDAATGLPLEFWDVPARAHTELWARGVRHVGLYSAYAAILVSMHGDTIYEKTFDPATARPENAEAVQHFQAEQQAFRDRAITRLQGDPTLASAVSSPELRRNKLILAAVDTLSLNICWGVSKAVEIADVPTSGEETATLTLAVGRNGLSLDPWPFGPDTLSMRLEARALRPVADVAALAVAFERAVPVMIETRLHRL